MRGARHASSGKIMQHQLDELIPEVDQFIERLAQQAEDAGYRLYLVGGAVRDQLMDHVTHDFDLSTRAPVELIRHILQDAAPDSIYKLGEKFGTLGAIIGGARVEVTTFRAQEGVNQGDERAALYADLAHRDFTINSMARDLHSGELHDPNEGQLDLKHRLVRAVGEPQERFREDPLRLLRAVRLAAQFDFFIDRQTSDAIRELAPQLMGVAQERIGEELDKLIVTEKPSEAITMLDSLGLLEQTIPEMLQMHEMERGPHRYKDVYPHTLKVLDKTDADLVLRWAALLHDVAKPATYSVHEGEVHFFGHDKLGARMARQILTRLRRPADIIEPVAQLVAEHLRIGVYDGSWSDGAVRRFLRETAPVTERLFALSRADITSQRPQRVAAALVRVDALWERCERLKAEEEVEKLASPLDGNELMQLFGGKPGPWIARVKEYLLGLVLDGELGQEDREGAERLAREFVTAHPEFGVAP